MGRVAVECDRAPCTDGAWSARSRHAHAQRAPVCNWLSHPSGQWYTWAAQAASQTICANALSRFPTAGGCANAASDEAYFPGRCAEVLYNGNRIGVFGIVHPDVSKNFELGGVVSALELEIEPFL